MEFKTRHEKDVIKAICYGMFLMLGAGMTLVSSILDFPTSYYSALIGLGIVLWCSIMLGKTRAHSAYPNKHRAELDLRDKMFEMELMKSRNTLVVESIKSKISELKEEMVGG